MTKKLLLVLVTISMAFSIVYAATVSQQSAQTIALNFFKLNSSNSGQAQLSASLSYTQVESNGSVDFYVFDMSPGKGFVIVSATDNVKPVLGYSTESSFNTNFANTGVNDWVKNTSKKISYAVTNNVAADAKIQNAWQCYAAGKNPVTSKAAVIGPLLKTVWNQEPYYNAICPVEASTGSRAVTGCVATAMAQIMKYWSYPTQGTGTYTYTDNQPNYSYNFGTQTADFGSTTYRWSAMTNSVSSNTSPVDSLMYQLGVAVAMSYGTAAEGGSGAFVMTLEVGPNQPCSQYAYATYFGYDPNSMQGVRESSYSSADWFNLMANELNSGRVIQYEGDDPTAGGHTWVCDGYDNNGMLHMNWGWGGSSNGFFSPGDLSTPGYNPVQNEAALIGIQPLYPFAVSATVNNPTICLGSSTTLTANGPLNATYTWKPTTAIICPTCQITDVAPHSTTLYTCTIDSAGVTAQVSVTVVIAAAVKSAFTFNPEAGCSLPQKVSFGNASTNATDYFWRFGDGTTDTTSSPVHTFNSFGTYKVQLVAANACYNDTLVKPEVVNVVNKLPLATEQNICSGQTATLNVVDTFGSLTWYDAPSGGNVVTTGNNYTTPALSNTTTYYVDASIAAPGTKAGALDSTIGSASYYTHNTQRGLVFDNLAPQTLVSVEVFASGTLSRTITLLDASGATLNSATLTIADGQQTVPLNFALPVATGLQLVIGGYHYLMRNSSGASYPYTSGDGNLTITGNTAGNPAYYYYFYNWQLQPAPCVTPRTAVPVFVLQNGSSSFNGNGTYSAVHFVPADTAATSYSWNFGDGNTSTDVSPVHAYSADGSYTVQLTISNGSCSDVISQTINTTTLGINNIASLESMNVFPNPAKDLLSINIRSAQLMDNCTLTIRNAVGQQIAERNIGLDEGVNTYNFNVGGLASGIYLVTLRNGQETVTRRFVKED